MSYCRWGDGSIYAYDSVEGGVQVNIAGRQRLPGPYPQKPDFPQVVTSEHWRFYSPKAQKKILAGFFRNVTAYTAWLNSDDSETYYSPILHPLAGLSHLFTGEQRHADAAFALTIWRMEGLAVRQYAIEGLLEEQRDRDLERKQEEGETL